MLKVNLERWQHSPERLREQAFSAHHARTRERVLALYEISQGKSATQIGWQTGRNPQTIMDWVHRYNQGGLESLVYHRTGGHPPL
ncbi:MAG: helix-turn-helix domain-containing protein [Stenomitos rutilans HA7619-LM2]|jgi:transposase|nr:helix-turn-helix domain-containing protein [Stenomitos rutilans HA7619-LM2]